MGRKASGDLFRLIQGLDSFERRRIEQFTSRHKRSDKNLYRNIFRVLSGEASFDNESLRIALGRRISGAHLSAAKSYLFQSILTAVSQSEWKKSKDAKLRSMLDQVEWLHGKGMPDLALKMLRKGIRIAKEEEAFLYEAEFLRWQRRLIKWKGGRNLYLTLMKIGKQEIKALENHSRDARLRDVRSLLQSLLLIQSQTPGKKSEKLPAELIMALQPANRPPANHFSALQSWYFSKAYAGMLTGNDAEARDAFLSLLQKWKERPAAISQAPRKYLETVSLFADISLKLKSVNKIEHWIEEFSKVKVKDKADQVWVFFYGHHLWLRFAMVTGKLQDALSRSALLEKGLTTYRQFLPASSALTLRFNLGVLFFLSGRERDALHQFNLIRNLPGQHQRRDLTDASRLIECLVHMDKGDYELVEYLGRSACKKEAAPLFRLVIRLARKFSGMESGRQRNSVLADALGQCLEIPMGHHVSGYEELKIWLTAGVQGKTMEGVLRRGIN